MPKSFPTRRRHSLPEEAGSLRQVAAHVKQQLKDGKIKQLDPMLERLVKLNDDGLIEAYVLFARVDQGIAEDYPGYRKANRDKLRRYLLEYVSADR